MIELIGTNAGKVWNALNEGGKMSLKAPESIEESYENQSGKRYVCRFGMVGQRR